MRNIVCLNHTVEQQLPLKSAVLKPVAQELPVEKDCPTIAEGSGEALSKVMSLHMQNLCTE